MIPAIDLLDGRAVFLTAGEADTAELVSEDPVALAKRWQGRGARRLHIVDLNAALGSGDNREAIRAILQSVTITAQVGGGLRDEEALRDVLASGAARAIVGTRAVREPEWLHEMAVRFPSRLILALDRDARGVLVEGWTKTADADVERLVEEANRLPLDAVLFTDVSVEGRLQGVGPADPLVRRCSKTRIAAGGVTRLEDLVALRRAGFHHAVVGKALHTGSLAFEAAQEALP